jgi:transcriptional regulator with XRE-family HTH domain
MNNDFKDKSYRDAFVEEFIRQGIAFQIRSLRLRENWSQKDLGENTDKPQNVISRLEDPNYGSFTISTLLQLASAFDVALMVRFVSFSDLWKQSQRLSPSDLAVARFSDEPEHSECAIDHDVMTHHEITAGSDVLPTWEEISSPTTPNTARAATCLGPFTVTYSGNV